MLKNNVFNLLRLKLPKCIVLIFFFFPLFLITALFWMLLKNYVLVIEKIEKWSEMLTFIIP